MDTPVRRVLDLSADGLTFVPALGMSRTVKATEGARLHRHDRIVEITACERGSVKFDCNDRVRTLLPGHVFMTFPEDAHRLRLNPNGARLYWLFLKVPRRGEALPSCTVKETNWLFGRLRSVPDRLFRANGRILDLFKSMFAAIDSTAPTSPERIFRLRTISLSLVAAVADAGHAAGREPSDRAVGSLIDEIRRNPERDFGIDRLIERTRLSPSSIRTAFYAATGMPPHAFLISCRIRAAKAMLRTTARTVADIAAELRFSTPQHFAALFRRETGRSPAEWRRDRA